MNYVEKLLKGRKAGAELELSHCDPDNPDYDEPRAKRIEEINQIEQALLVLHNVSKCDPYIHNVAIQFGGKCGKCGTSKRI